MEIVNLNGFAVEVHWAFALPLAAMVWTSWFIVLATVAKKSREAGEGDK